MNKLSKRLTTIAGIVTGKVVCDVGCDHGLLSEYLLDANIINFAYVSDISASSLRKAEILLSKNHKNRFKAICTDGLEDYKCIEDIDECIISGMGGIEIIKIIKNSPISMDSYILSPQHNIVETKKFMLSLGYDIVYDIIIKDKHKFYTIFKCKKSNKIKGYSEYELLIGKDNFTSRLSDVREYIDFEMDKSMKLIDRVDNDKKNELLGMCELLKKAKKELKNHE